MLFPFYAYGEVVKSTATSLPASLSLLHEESLQNVIPNVTRLVNRAGIYLLKVNNRNTRKKRNLGIQSKCGKIQTRKTPNPDTIHSVSGTATLLFSLKHVW